MKLVTFGDSWPYGADLRPEEKPFGSILAELLQSTSYTNMSEPATSNEHMILQVKKYVDLTADVSGDIAVFFITSTARACYIDYNNQAVEVRPDARAARDSLHYYYYRYFHTPAHEQFRHYATILALQRLSEQLNFQDFYIMGWEQPSFDYPGINKTKIYSKTCTQMFAQEMRNPGALYKNNVYINVVGQHPTQLGHKLIANNLYHWIKEQIVQSKI